MNAAPITPELPYLQGEVASTTTAGDMMTVAAGLMSKVDQCV